MISAYLGSPLGQQDAVKVTSIERGTGERIECRRNGFVTCGGTNASGSKLINSVVTAAQELVYAARKLIGETLSRRPLDGTLTLADIQQVQRVLQALPTKLLLDTPSDDMRETLLFAFMHDTPRTAVRIVANDPEGFIKLAKQIRQGRFGAAQLIDKPRGYYLSRALAPAAGVGIVGLAVYFAIRS